ncbi:Hypothetical predicted protein [Paramuricea clavata]|uniref:Uncharacterized protein n=1 Tax=Paramuricea clavata TaxID=317549 RepID=A0A6S7IKC0_PARCT|nr:Hypothetical predicted protein [Paramuricea clavata]
MANYLRTKLHFLIGLAGCLVVFFGIFILSSATKINVIIRHLHSFRRFGDNTCQYWAGILTILTGGVLILTFFLKRHQSLKYISLCCVLVTIVLALGVIIEESTNAAILHGYFKKDSYCDDETVFSYRKKDCDELKEVNIWYYILLYATDLVLALCSFVMLLLFADWTLFVAPKMQPLDGLVAQEVLPSYQQMSNTQPGNHNEISMYP